MENVATPRNKPQKILDGALSTQYRRIISNPSESLSDQLREAILTADVSRYRLAKEVGLTEAALSRFVNGGSRLRLSSIDRITAYLGLRLVVDEKPKKKRKGQ